MPVRLIALIFFVVSALGAVAAVAQDQPGPPVIVIEVHDPMDQRLMDFVSETLRETDAHLFVLQIDSSAMSSGDPEELFAAISTASAPVVVWAGAAPASVHGGSASLLNIADIGAAAPGVHIGYLDPTVVKTPDLVAPVRLDHGQDQDESAVVDADALLRSGVVTVEEPIAGYVDVVVPTIGQLIAGLDGVEVARNGSTFTLATARAETADGETVIVSAREVRFLKPDLWDRFLRLSSRPETTLFFLIAGVAIATFEFYAAGVGITAAVAAVCLFLSGYGLATLPVRWLSVAAVLAGLFLYTWDFQRNQLALRTLAGTALLLGGGLTLTDAAPQFGPSWWVVTLIVIGALLFYAFALTTIARSRFSTRTIGRESLVGKAGLASSDLDPDGVVDIDGARWRARSHREAGIRKGDQVEVLEVSGIVLEVGPAASGPAVRE